MWTVGERLTARGTAADKVFCFRVDAASVAASQNKQLEHKLLHGSTSDEPCISLDKLMLASQFVAHRGWGNAGMRADDVATSGFVVRYMRMLLDQVALSRGKSAPPPGRADSDEQTAQISVALQGDVEWLEKEAVHRYIAHHHPATTRLRPHGTA